MRYGDLQKGDMMVVRDSHISASSDISEWGHFIAPEPRIVVVYLVLDVERKPGNRKVNLHVFRVTSKAYLSETTKSPLFTIRRYLTAPITKDHAVFRRGEKIT